MQHGVHPLHAAVARTDDMLPFRHGDETGYVAKCMTRLIRIGQHDVCSVHATVRFHAYVENARSPRCRLPSRTVASMVMISTNAVGRSRPTPCHLVHEAQTCCRRLRCILKGRRLIIVDRARGPRDRAMWQEAVVSTAN